MEIVCVARRFRAKIIVLEITNPCNKIKPAECLVEIDMFACYLQHLPATRHTGNNFKDVFKEKALLQPLCDRNGT